jgi:flagellar hook-basal body complex protein FliE
MNPLDPIAKITIPAVPELRQNPSSMVSGETSGSGENVFGKLLEQVSDLQSQSAALEQRMLNGEDVELHRVMIAAEEAGTAFELLVEMRNRLVDAYQELMRMPV